MGGKEGEGERGRMEKSVRDFLESIQTVACEDALQCSFKDALWMLSDRGREILAARLQGTGIFLKS